MSIPLTVKPLGPRIGAEALQLDLAGALSAKTLTELETALIKHEALVLHVPDMTPEQHLAIARHFGQAEVHTFYPNLGARYEQITVIDSKLGDRADMWHHDESFLPSPPIVTMTHAQILPPTGGDTCWISMTSAYDALSPRMKQYLEGLQAWHDMNAPMTAALQHGVVTHERYVEVVSQNRRHLHPWCAFIRSPGARRSISVQPMSRISRDCRRPKAGPFLLTCMGIACRWSFSSSTAGAWVTW